MSEKRKIFILWNPASGGKSKKIVNEFVDFIVDKHLFEVYDTREFKGATQVIVNKLDQSFTDLVIVGGDGTINEAVNGLKFDIPVSIIPAGTGNDFIKNIEIGKNIRDRFETALYGAVSRIDLGQCNDRIFVNGVGIGFDGQIVEDMESKRVPLLSGHAAYYYHVLRILGGYKEKPFDYHINGENLKKDLILLTIGNGTTFGGGFKLMPDAKLDDGLLEVCEIGKLSGLKRFLNIHRLSNGSHGALKAVNFYRTTELKVEENLLLYAHIDGERMGQPPYHIKVLPGKLQIRTTS